jgi:hypothetical protein
LDVYYDIGKGYGEKYKIGKSVRSSNDFQTVRLRLPFKHLKSFRIDPLTEPCIIYIKSIKLSSFFGRQYLWSARDVLRDFAPQHDIGRFELFNDSLIIESIGSDPYFSFTGKMPDIDITMGNKFVLLVISCSVLLLISLTAIRFRSNLICRLSGANAFIWLGLIILLAIILRSYHITFPLNDIHSFRQTQTAGLIRDFYRDGINLFYPRVISLGNPGYVVLEFPLYQTLASLFYKILTPEIIWARILSIICGALSILFVYRITTKFADKTSAIFASLFFALSPLNIFYNRVPMPDSLTILLSLIMLDFLIEGINNRNNILLIFGIVAGCFGLMMKSPYVAPIYLPTIYTAYIRDKKIRSFINIRFLSAFFIPIAMMVLWQRHANAVNEIYFNTDNYPFEELYSSVIVKLYPFNKWYFGTIAQRLDFGNYLIILKRIFQEMLSIVGILFLALGFYALIKKKIGAFFYIWLFSVLCSIILVFNLNVVHNFYQLPLTPILSIFCGTGCAYLIDVLKDKKVASLVTAVLISIYLFTSLTIAKNRLFVQENDWVEVGQIIDNHTEKNTMIATSLSNSDGWDPRLLYYSDRHGFNLHHRRLNKEMITYLSNSNIKYLAIVDFKNEDVLNNDAISPYKIVTKNNRVIIYDISSR